MNRVVVSIASAAVLFLGILGVHALLRREPAAPRGTDAVSAPQPPKEGGMAKPPEGTPAGKAMIEPAPEARTPPAASQDELPLARGDSSLVFEIQGSTGEPLEGAKLTLLRGRRSRAVDSAPDGTARFDSIEAGSYSFTLDVEGLPGLVSARQVQLERRAMKRVPVTVGDFTLSIAGRVLRRDGTTVEGITVRARRIVESPREGEVVRSEQESLAAVSRRGGAFEIRGVDASEHMLRTDASNGYPAVEKQARGGSRSVDIVLDAGQAFRVEGRVLTRDNEAIPEAAVFPLGERDRGVLSDASGRYRLDLHLLNAQSIVVLGCVKEGYREGRVSLRLEEIGSAESWELDLVLDELGARGVVRGVVSDPNRAPVAGETVHIQSPSLTLRYEAVTDPSGRFSIPDVQVASDYRLSIYPRRGFADYSQTPIDVSEAGLDLEIVLEGLAQGTLGGVMVDPAGARVPHFTLWVKSLKALGSSAAVTGNAAGEFESAGIPEGELVFETRSEPRITLRGVRFDPSSPSEVKLVIDWGPHTVEGFVADDSGQAIGGANVQMIWASSADGQASSSHRTTVSDASGRFVFSELGAGDHKVTVSSPLHIPAQATCNPAAGGPALFLQLTPRPARGEKKPRSP